MTVPFATDVLRLVEQHQYLALFVLILLEEAGIPLPVPGDGLMMFAGYRASEGRLSFPLAFVFLESGTIVGASILRWIGRWGGRPLVHRYGHYVHLDEHRLVQAEQWFDRHGALAVLLGRVVPGLRIPTSLMSGIFDIPYRVFLPYMALGSSLYILFFMLLGWGLGEEAAKMAILLWLHPLVVAAVIVLLISGALLIIRLRRRVRT